MDSFPFNISNSINLLDEIEEAVAARGKVGGIENFKRRVALVVQLYCIHRLGDYLEEYTSRE